MSSLFSPCTGKREWPDSTTCFISSRKGASTGSETICEREIITSPTVSSATEMAPSIIFRVSAAIRPSSCAVCRTATSSSRVWGSPEKAEVRRSSQPRFFTVLRRSYYCRLLTSLEKAPGRPGVGPSLAGCGGLSVTVAARSGDRRRGQFRPGRGFFFRQVQAVGTAGQRFPGWEATVETLRMIDSIWASPLCGSVTSRLTSSRPAMNLPSGRSRSPAPAAWPEAEGRPGRGRP